jgi:hypothetical protein
MSPLARLLFVGLWGVADREGRMKWRPADFKLQILPGDDCDIHALCQEILDRGMVVLYGDGLAYIPSFLDHQSINPREQISKLPPPDASLTRDDASNPDLHAQRGREGKGKEGKDTEAKASGADAPKIDPVKVLFDEGVKLLTDTGTPESQARSLIGRWRKAHGDDATRTAIQAAYDHGAIAPVEFIVASLTRAPKAHETWDQRRIREAMEAIQ